MDTAEYLAFIPLLFYGIALADLIGQWRRFFDKDYLSLPYFLTTIVFTEVAIFNVYTYLEVVKVLEDVSYRQYWFYLVQPMIFLLAVSALTPEAEVKDTGGYFRKRIPLVFGLMAAFISSHFLGSFSFSPTIAYIRGAAIALCIVIAVTRKVWIIYLLSALWFVSLFARV